MTLQQSKRFEIRMSGNLLKAIDRWRRRQSDLPSRSEGIRRLVEAGLRARKQVKKAKR